MPQYNLHHYRKACFSLSKFNHCKKKKNISVSENLMNICYVYVYYFLL